tara:strand:+ start:955 stop:1335 length:381 start_codon:yes stop_codon:yes gene_type:complete
MTWTPHSTEQSRSVQPQVTKVTNHKENLRCLYGFQPNTAGEDIVLMTEYQQNNTPPPAREVTLRQQWAVFAVALVAATAGITAVVYLTVTPSSVQPIMLELAGDVLRLVMAACAAGALIGALAVRR